MNEQELKELLREVFRHWLADSDPDELLALCERVERVLREP